MDIRLGETITLDFATHHPTTGAATDGDSLPTCEVYEDAIDTALAGVTVTKRVGKTGNYHVEIVATTGNGYEAGKSYNAVASATVNSITGKGVIGSWVLRDAVRLGLTALPNAAPDAAGGLIVSDAGGLDADAMKLATAQIGTAGAGLTALGDTRIAYLDAAVSSRSTYAGGAVASVTAPVTAGTVSDKTGYSLAVAPPTVAQIGAQITADHGAGNYAATANQGAGADSVTITVLDANSDPIADCEVWITSDAGGSAVVAGTLTTDDDGTATFLLTAGTTYYCWRRKSGETFTNPATFVAVAD